MTRPRTSFDSYHTEPSTSHHRSLSPLHLPSTSCTRQTKHTRRQDASRLLDPSYSSAAPSTAVYIDHHGDAHDPDYRYFPAVQQPTRKRHAQALWEDAMDDEDEEEEEETGVNIFDRRYGASGAVRRSSWGSSSPRSNSHRDTRGRRRHSGSFGTTNTSSSPTSGRSMSLFSTGHYHNDSPPTSYEEESALNGEEFIQQYTAAHHAKEKKSLLAAPKHLKRKRHSKGAQSGSVSSTCPLDADEPISPISLAASSSLPHSSFSHTYVHTPAQVRYSPEEPLHTTTTTASAPPAVGAGAGDWTPTCGQSLRRQWQAIALRFRFGVFRAQRRVKRRVHSLL